MTHVLCDDIWAYIFSYCESLADYFAWSLISNHSKLLISRTWESARIDIPINEIIQNGYHLTLFDIMTNSYASRIYPPHDYYRLTCINSGRIIFFRTPKNMFATIKYDSIFGTINRQVMSKVRLKTNEQRRNKSIATNQNISRNLITRRNFMIRK